MLHLIWRVAEEPRSYITGDPPRYKPQWFQHRGEKLRSSRRLIDNGATQVATPYGPGDFAMYNFGRHAAHGAILVDGNRVIHAYALVGRVTIGDQREATAQTRQLLDGVLISGLLKPAPALLRFSKRSTPASRSRRPSSATRCRSSRDGRKSHSTSPGSATGRCSRRTPAAARRAAAAALRPIPTQRPSSLRCAWGPSPASFRSGTTSRWKH